MPKVIPNVPVPPGMKWCCGCRTVKTPQEFYRNRKAPDGRSARCIPCVRQMPTGAQLASGLIAQMYARGETLKARDQAAPTGPLQADWRPPWEPKEVL